MPQLTMPNVGEGVAEGTVTRWLKREGESVALDEPVVEVETDKAVVEIPSPFEGTLSKIIVGEGETVPIGAPLGEISSAGVAATVAAPAAPARASSRAPARADAAVRPPDDGGARPANGRAAPASGPSGASVPSADSPRRQRRYSPVVLKLAEEHDIDLTLVRGTGIEGRVTRQDLLRYIENPAANSAPPPEGAGVVGAPEIRGGKRELRSETGSTNEPASSQTPSSAPVDAGEVTALSPTRRTIAARMLESHRTIPVAWMAVEADVTGLVALRERAKSEFEQREGVALTYMPFFVQAIVAALKEHPALNATFEDTGMRQHRRYDIGIAVAAESGLVVPVIRNAGDHSIAGLAREIDTLGRKAHDRKLTVDEMRGATFTIDNTGAFGSLISQPIVPAGQVAIITTEAVRREVRARDDGAIAVRSVMNLAISFDHRALDGAEAGRFMRTVRERLEAYRAEQPVD